MSPQYHSIKGLYGDICLFFRRKNSRLMSLMATMGTQTSACLVWPIRARGVAVPNGDIGDSLVETAAIRALAGAPPRGLPAPSGAP